MFCHSKAVTDHWKSKQLLLLAFTYLPKQQTAVTAYLKSQQLLLLLYEVTSAFTIYIWAVPKYIDFTMEL